MNRRLAVSLAALVAWLLITVVGGRIRTGQGPLTEAVTRGLGWPFLLAALLLEKLKDATHSEIANTVLNLRVAGI